MTPDKAAAWLKARLDFEFSDEQLLKQALTHRSAPGDNNERLEFLGDSILQLVISERIFHERPDASEGRLSRLRSSLVKDTTLSEIGVELGVGEVLYLGAGEKKTGGHRRRSILADAVEALFGAAYLDGGFEAAKKLIHTFYGERLDNLPRRRTDLRDPKTRLQEHLQANRLPLPNYEMEKISGQAHRQHFEVSCSLAEPEIRTIGSGASRRDAEQAAAESALAMLESLDGPV